MESGESNVEQNCDRLSGFPDDVLCNILSFLPTKKSVGTSILSKRWEKLWAHVPVLVFEYCDKLLYPIFVSLVLLRYKETDLNTFKLSFIECRENILWSWIDFVLQRNVRNISLLLCDEHRFYTLPRRLFTCKTLVELELYYCCCIPSSGDVSLPSLKKLLLSKVEYKEEEALPHLLSGCPVLEDLTTYSLDPFDCHEEFVCEKITSSTVISLTVILDCGCPNNPPANPPKCRMIIKAPTVSFLKVGRCCLDCLTIEPTMTSLMEADLSLLAGFGYTENAVDFLISIRNAKCLKISAPLDEPIDLPFSGSLVKLDKLTKLELDLGFDLHNLEKFLGLANNLEELNVIVKEKSCVETENEPTFSLSRLRTICVDCSMSENEEFDMVRYVLMNARVLERMEIRVEEEKFEALKRRISLFKRGSRKCQITCRLFCDVGSILVEL